MNYATRSALAIGSGVTLALIAALMLLEGLI